MIAPGSQVKRLVDGLDDAIFIHMGGTKGIDHNGERLRNANGVGELDLTAIGKTSSNHILGNPACGIGSRTVNFGAILAREGTAAMTAHAAIGIDDDLAAGKAGVAHRAANDKTTSGVNVDVGIVANRHALGIHNGGNHVLDHVVLDDAHILDLGSVLRGNDDSRPRPTGLPSS